MRLDTNEHCMLIALRAWESEADDDTLALRTAVSRAEEGLQLDDVRYSVSPDGILIAVPDRTGERTRAFLRKIREQVKIDRTRVSGAISMGELIPVRKVRQAWLADNFEGEAAIRACRILVAVKEGELGIDEDAAPYLDKLFIDGDVTTIKTQFPGKRTELFPGLLASSYFAIRTVAIEERLFEQYVDREPLFQYRARSIAASDDALAGTCEPGFDAAGVLEQHWGLMLLQARGGAGKSAFLSDLGKAAVRRGDTPFLVELSGDTPTADTLFANSRIGTRHTFEHACEQGGRVLLLTDGLDGLEGNIAKDTLSLLRQLLDKHRNLRIVVADRVVRRVLAPTDQIWTLNPLDTATIKAHVAPSDQQDGLEILDTPFFLNLWIRHRPPKQRRRQRVAMILNYLDEHANVPTAHVPRLARAAFEAYGAFKTAEFSRAWWVARVGVPLSDALATAGVTVGAGGDHLRFFHQLIQDALVGIHVSTLPPNEWDGESLDIATLWHRGFEALVFAAEALGGSSDEFVVRVYDWSYPYAFRCIADLTRHSPGSVSSGLTLALTALQAEKMFDTFIETRVGAKERLKKTQGPAKQIADDFLKAQSMSDVIGIVQRTSVEAGLAGWKAVFTSNPTAVVAVTRADAAHLSMDPLIGWTAANVYRRPMYVIGEEAETALVEMFDLALSNNTPSVRWRVVHLLGRATTESARDFLVKAASEDAYDWVRYGAVRGLVEIAARSVELRVGSLTRLVELIPGMKPDVLDEIGKSAQVDEKAAAPGWPAAILPVLEQAMARVPAGDRRKLAWARWHAAVRAGS